jgi:hypothetical protein
MAAVAAEGVAHAAGFVVLPVLSSSSKLDTHHQLELKRVAQGGKRTLLLAKE